jgi:hypothetical protein
LYGGGPAEDGQVWKSKLSGAVISRGLWLEEIIAGKTREGVPFSQLGWGDKKKIPLGHMIVGKANNDEFRTSWKAMVDDNGVVKSDWQSTLLGKTFIELGIDPTKTTDLILTADGKATPYWDIWYQRQASMRDLRDEVLRPSDLTGEMRDLDEGTDLNPRFNFGGGWVEFYRPTRAKDAGKGPKASDMSPRDWDFRMYDENYEEMNERQAAIRKEFEAIRRGDQ